MIGPPIGVGPGASAQASLCIKAALPRHEPSGSEAVIRQLTGDIHASTPRGGVLAAVAGNYSGQLTAVKELI